MNALRLAWLRTFSHIQYRIWVTIFRCRVNKDMLAVLITYLFVICFLSAMVALFAAGVWR